MTVKGKFSAYTEAEKSFVVQQFQVGLPFRSLGSWAAADVHMLRFMKKITCSVSDQLLTNVHVAGDMYVLRVGPAAQQHPRRGQTLLAQTTVRIETLKDMSKLPILMFEDGTVDLGTSNHEENSSVMKPRSEAVTTNDPDPMLLKFIGAEPSPDKRGR
ncbi:hypothetical protein PF008_g26294 [Phytophthora fragariae]|uniref:Uncharacterized protein n=1 Tax=Phytophthora fragariae TaxID=53985 RepID=A0A6G0QHM9_9STRA|nr:hypothetical protein PF008_g26294 [Phytophthora fragariae]